MTKNKSRPVAMLTAGLLALSLDQAQQSFNASGGDAIGSGETIAYSVGHIDYTSNTGVGRFSRKFISSE